MQKEPTRRLEAKPFVFAIVFALATGCGDGPPAAMADVARDAIAVDGRADSEVSVEEDPLIPLINHTLWTQITDGDGGLFADHRPPVIECGETGLYQEDGFLEVNTSDCNYLEVVQSSLVDVGPGETIEASLWYGPLVAEGIAEAHAAIVIDGEVLWQRQIPIPNPGGLAVAIITPTRTYPAGTEILFHLHNHGLNTWNLVYIGKY